MSTGKPSFRATAITIACTDYDRSGQFYEQAFGAVRDARDGYGCRWYKLGSIWLTLIPNASEPTPARFPEHPMAMLWLETDDLPAAAERLAGMGVEVLQPFDGESMMVTDPDGIVIEIWQAEPGIERAFDPS